MLCNCSDVLDSKGIRLNVIDQSSILPAHISNLIGIIENLTNNNKNITLNIIIGHVGKYLLENSLHMSHVATWRTGIFIFLGEAQLNTLASNLQLLTDQPAPELGVFSNCILSSGNEPQLIISNRAHKRLSDYLVWKVSAHCSVLLLLYWKVRNLAYIAVIPSIVCIGKLFYWSVLGNLLAWIRRCAVNISFRFIILAIIEWINMVTGSDFLLDFFDNQ